jgi:tetratricopeptide (TPR) repeat protein
MYKLCIQGFQEDMLWYDPSMPSIAQLEKLREIDPQDPFVHYGLGQECAKLGQLEDAAKHYSQTIELDPTYCYAYYFLGQTLHELDRHPDAFEVLDRGIKIATEVGEGKAIAELKQLIQSLQ